MNLTLLYTLLIAVAIHLGMDVSAFRSPAPTATPVGIPHQLGWWDLEGQTATLAIDPPGSRPRDAATLTISCAPALRVAVSFDPDRNGVPRQLRPYPYDVPNTSGPRAGQIKVSLYTRGGTEMLREWWPVSRDYRWAYAPRPAAVVSLLRGKEHVQLFASETGSWSAAGLLPLDGLGDVLTRLTCVD